MAGNAISHSISGGRLHDDQHLIVKFSEGQESMYCPICKSEYRSGFTTCSDCQVQLVTELPKGALMEPREDILLRANGPVAWIKRKKLTSWLLALSVGILFRLLYVLAKNGIWNSTPARKLANLIAKMDTSPFSGFMTDTSPAFMMLNFIAELSSSAIPALICGALLTRVFQEKARLFIIGAMASFLILDSRLWRYWNDPNASLGFKIEGFAAPLLVGLVLAFTVWLFRKKNERTK